MQLGHQAANCKTGTIPWRIVFGDEAFIVRKPVFWTDVLAKREQKDVDLEQLKTIAQKYADEQCTRKGLDYEEVQKVAEASKDIDVEPLLAKRKRELEEEEEAARRAADPKADVPAGWNVAFVRPSPLRHSNACWLRPCVRVLWPRAAAYECLLGGVRSDGRLTNSSLRWASARGAIECAGAITSASAVPPDCVASCAGPEGQSVLLALGDEQDAMGEAHCRHPQMSEFPDLQLALSTSSLKPSLRGAWWAAYICRLSQYWSCLVLGDADCGAQCAAHARASAARLGGLGAYTACDMDRRQASLNRWVTGRE